jgi:hypothetical protein
MFHVPGPLIFLTALSAEAAAVRRGVSGPTGVRVGAVGIRCNRGIDQKLLDGAGLVIVAGLAGALDPDLAIGDIVLDDPAGLVPDRPLWRRGTILSVDQLVATSDVKTGLLRQTGAIAVDMETKLVRQRTDVPVIGLRAISDRACDPVEPVVMSLVNDLGRPRPIMIARTLIRRPRLIGHLRRLQKDTNLALSRLELAVAGLLDAFARPASGLEEKAEPIGSASDIFH